MVEAERHQRTVKRLHRVLVAHLVYVGLCRDEELLAGNAAACDRAADSRFVLVRACCVDESIAAGDGVAHNLLAISLGDLKDTEAFLWHLNAV